MTVWKKQCYRRVQQGPRGTNALHTATSVNNAERYEGHAPSPGASSEQVGLEMPDRTLTHPYVCTGSPCSIVGLLEDRPSYATLPDKRSDGRPSKLPAVSVVSLDVTLRSSFLFHSQQNSLLFSERPRKNSERRCSKPTIHFFNKGYYDVNVFFENPKP